MKGFLAIALLAISSTAWANSSCDSPKNDFDGLYCLNKVYQQADTEDNQPGARQDNNPPHHPRSCTHLWPPPVTTRLARKWSVSLIPERIGNVATTEIAAKMSISAKREKRSPRGLSGCLNPQI